MSRVTEHPDCTITLSDGAPRRFSDLSRMYVERGTIDDWNKLHELHYKSDTKQLWGPQYFRCVLDGETIGVIVLTTPRLLSGGRHKAMPNIRPGADTKITNTYRGKVVSKEITVVARVVNDTLYRGVGVSYRMVNLACRMAGFRIYEIASSMSKVNPFAQRAGFRFVKPEPSRYYKPGLRFMRSLFESESFDHEVIMAELDSKPAPLRERLIEEMRHWYYTNSPKEKTGGGGKKTGKQRTENMPPAMLVKELQQLIFGMPAYGLYVNPDAGRELPSRLPLTAFDNQREDEPLALEKI